MPPIFTLVAPSVSHFLTVAIVFMFFFFPNKIGLRCYLFFAIAFSLLSKLMYTLKFSGKKDSFFVVKVREAM